MALYFQNVIDSLKLRKHMNKGGLSSARNAGIEVAKGSYFAGCLPYGFLYVLP